MEEVQGLDCGVADEKINVKSADGEIIQVDRRAARACQFFRPFLDLNPGVTEIEIKQCVGKHVRKVCEYLEHYKDKEPRRIKPPLVSKEFLDVADPWDAKFVHAETPDEVQDLLDLTETANFMCGLEHPLTELCCARQAHIFRTNSREQLKKLFRQEKELTPEEEAEVRRKYPEYFVYTKQEIKSESE